MSSPRVSDAFAAYLTSRPSAPVGFKKVPHSLHGLFELAGGYVPSRGGWPKSLVYWDAQLRTDAFLRNWVRSGSAFLAPEDWPEKARGVLPDWVTPRVFAENVLPSDDVARRRGMVARTEGLWSLDAYAHGWPLRPDELDHVKPTMERLMKNPAFLVWAYDLNVDLAPMPFSKVDYFKRLDARAKLSDNPLGMTPLTLSWALPETLHDPVALLRLPRRSDGVNPARKYVTLMDVNGLDVAGPKG